MPRSSRKSKASRKSKPSASRKSKSSVSRKSKTSKSKKSKSKMAADQCYCVSCKKGVNVKDMKKIQKGNRCRMVGKCAVCGTTVNKFCKC